MKTILLLLVLLLIVPAYAIEMDGFQKIIVSRGDPLVIPVDGAGSCWYFAKEDNKKDTSLYDIPTMEYGNTSTCTLSGDRTNNIEEGEYYFVNEEAVWIFGKPVKDVTYKDGYLVSVLATTKPVDVQTFTPAKTKDTLIQMLESDGMNRYYTTIIGMQEPSLKITDFGMINHNEYFIAGTSNQMTGTIISIDIETPELPNKTFQITAPVKRESDNTLEGIWDTKIILPIDDMAPGWHTINARSGGLLTTVQFPIYMADSQSDNARVNNTIKYLGDGNIAPKIINVTVTVIETKYVDRWHTATPTPAITDIFGDTINYPYQSQAPRKDAAYAGIVGLVGTTMAVAVIRRK